MPNVSRSINQALLDIQHERYQSMILKLSTAVDFRHIEEGNSYLMGTMLEKSRRKRKIWRYQRPAKCCRATMTRDTTTRAPNRILVRQFTSRSNRPICNSTSHTVECDRFKRFGLWSKFMLTLGYC